ncbi:hypothetical protein QEZ54_29055 [Catellatospora sp. KI3]|uniref:hypothetical protein n=1 Tax=Catellatospora sp. KI3 TaxID=3041620 RepID=UPI002483086F|nr:hypothetical protein [Catellatospora sp. KI3]MDI1465026.1 hypothetical protein [Catellatospora sp. KI3]
MIDLRELMDERSAPPADLAQHLRLADLRHRIAVRRNRRIGGVLAAVVALGAIGYGLVPALRDGGVSQPAGPGAGFPQYLEGTRIIATTRSQPGINSLTLTFTPPGLSPFKVFTDCTGAAGLELRGELGVDGMVRQSGSCGGDDLVLSWQIEPEQQGQEMSVKLRVIAADRETQKNTAFPPGATIAMAVGVPVPYDAYPLPDRPAVLGAAADARQLLAGWEGLTPEGRPVTDKVWDPLLWLRSDPQDPLRPRTVTVHARDGYSFIAQSVTPGSLRIQLDGVDLQSAQWWGYDAELRVFTCYLGGPVYDAGKPGGVTITVIPEHVTGDWQLLVQADTPLSPPPPPPPPR